jgi:lysyl-tRNA synthetase class 1
MYRGCDHDGTMQVKDHNWKLKWRLDWPARQSFLGVTVEPSGKDHSVAGGSVDTALAVHEKIFQREPPLLERYGFITMKGKKFSGSKGGALPANHVADILPTSAYLFLVYRSDLLKDINFNPESLEYGTLLDEFDSAREMLLRSIEDYPGREREFNKLRTAADLAMTDEERGYLPAEVKFSELTTVYQTSLLDKQATVDKLERLNKFPNNNSKAEIINRLDILDNWLKNMAPDAIKIEFLDDIPHNIAQYWTDPIYEIWTRSIDQIEEDTSPDEFTEVLRSEADRLKIPPQKFYPPFYRLLTGKPRGPDASNLVLALGKDKLNEKFSQLKELL